MLSRTLMLLFFFFSSRRRHTRLQGDWSSDVCSSDLGDKMVYYSTDKNGRQLYTVDLKSYKSEQITHQAKPMSGEIVAHKRREVFYQIGDTVFATSIDNKTDRKSVV